VPDAGHAALALLFGSLIGLSLGALGAGGSLLTVPVLVYALGVPVQAATVTSLAVVGLNAAAGAADQLRRGRALPRTGLAFGGSGLLGALAGAWLNHRLRGELVLVLFSVLMVAAAIAMLRRRGTAGAAGFDERYGARGWLRIGALGLGVGFLSGLFGVGGGFLIVPALVLVVGLPTRHAVGTSLLAITLNAAWGLAGHLSFGGLEWGLTGLVVAGGLVGVLAGGRLTGRLPDAVLRRAFAVLVLGLAAYTFARSAAALAG
jgi:uncharacterized membrane protein YfcA